MKHRELIDQIDEQAVTDAIGRAEKSCSGEVRVHIERSARGRDLRAFGERTFERIGMTKTRDRTGVLIFICAEQQQFVVLGDRGIHERVGDEFWSSVAAHLEEHFKTGDFTRGLVNAIEEIGEQLRQHFPWERTDQNELPDAISRSDDD